MPNNTFDKKLLNIIACPRCHAKLEYDAKHQRLICRFEEVYYPIKEGVPILLASEATPCQHQKECKEGNQ